MSFIVQDIYEPDYMAQMLSTFMQVQRQNLVVQGLCDYFWFAHDGHSITIERKYWLDLLSSLGRLEKQLRTATNHADEVGLLVEGVAIPLAGGEIAIYQEGKNDRYLRRVKISGVKYAAVMSYLWEIDKKGMTVYHTSTLAASAWALKSFVECSQKVEFTLLQHYVRTKAIKWLGNPMVETIMGVKDEYGTVVGEKKAIELVTKIGCLWDIIHLPPEEIDYACDGIGLATAKRLIAATKRSKYATRK